MSLIEYKGAWFDNNTPDIVKDVILDCIAGNRLVHILTGDPLTGVVTPNILSVGHIRLSSGTKPVPMLYVGMQISANGVLSALDDENARAIWLKTDRILKINDVETGKLLFQSYECRCSPLKVIDEIKLSPYGDCVEKTKIVCSNPEMEIFIDKSVDTLELCRFLFGQIHITRDMKKCLDDHLKSKSAKT